VIEWRGAMVICRGKLKIIGQTLAWRDFYPLVGVSRRYHRQDEKTLKRSMHGNMKNVYIILVCEPEKQGVFRTRWQLMSKKYGLWISLNWLLKVKVAGTSETQSQTFELYEMRNFMSAILNLSRKFLFHGVGYFGDRGDITKIY
jgi:hypothetical protein